MKQHQNDYGFYALVGVGRLVFILAFTSCMTNRKGELTEKGKNFIALHCKGNDSTHISDNTTVLFDTVSIEHYTQGPIQYITSPCDSLGQLKPINITKKFNGITGVVKTVGNSLIFDCHTDSLMVIIETQKRVINTFESNKTVIQKPCELDHVSGTQWMWIRLGQIMSLFIIIQAAIRLASTYPALRWLKILYVFKV
jgi:hypothetical protein